MRLLLLALGVTLVSTSFAVEPPRTATGADVAFQLSRYQEDGRSEEFFLHCPPDQAKGCEIGKSVETVPVSTGTVKRHEAKKIVERFFEDLPSKDVVKGKEPSALEKSEKTAFLWQGKAGSRWSKGTLTHEDSRNPASDNGNHRKRLLALHGIQTRLAVFLTKPVEN